ncbi:hypothetical protein M758_6G029100 [Ceratodon purpureus]|nr:hypothetical protein M758_6G029100 [Ceratodon purpureus]
MLSKSVYQPRPRSPSPDVELLGESIDSSALGKHLDVVILLNYIHRHGGLIQPSRSSSPDVELLGELVDSSALGRHTEVTFVEVHTLEDILNPFLWGEVLPLELKQLIFARLPLPQIKSLRFLSKEWNRSVTSPGSLFRQICAEASTPTFALITPGDRDGTFYVHAYDPKLRNRWHVVKYTAPVNRQHVTICACDGGLACFLNTTSSVDREGPQVFISVWNPLTGDEKELTVLEPLSKCSRATRAMVQLSVDHHTKHYKVTVVLVNATAFIYGLHGVIHRYDSETGQWSTAEKKKSTGDILGFTHRCRTPSAPRNTCRLLCGQWQYDFAHRKVWFFKSKEDNAIASDAYSDHKYFQLWKPESRQHYSILEMHFCHPARKYRRVKKHHDCSPFDGFPLKEQKLHLYSCKEFLVVCASPCLWLYDLSTCTWRDLPALPQDRRLNERDVMCELQWNVVP